jgi:hypothetical protein
MLGGPGKYSCEREKLRGSVVSKDCASRRVTKLNDESIFLTTWSKMRVNLAKVIFSCETVAEILTNLVERYQIDAPKEIFDSPDEFDRVLQQKPGNVHPEILVNRAESIVNLIPNSENDNEAKTAQFLARIYCLFSETLLNQSKFITRENLAQWKQFFSKHLAWFSSWRARQMQEQRKKNKDWNQLFFATETWSNILTTISSFLNYSGYLFENVDSNLYVPMLRSNSSTIEGLFAHIRSMNAHNQTTLNSYKSNISKIHMKASLVALDRGRMYDKNDVLDNHIDGS